MARPAQPSPTEVVRLRFAREAKGKRARALRRGEKSHLHYQLQVVTVYLSNSGFFFLRGRPQCCSSVPTGRFAIAVNQRGWRQGIFLNSGRCSCTSSLLCLKHRYVRTPKVLHYLTSTLRYVDDSRGRRSRRTSGSQHLNQRWRPAKGGDWLVGLGSRTVL